VIPKLKKGVFPGCATHLTLRDQESIPPLIHEIKNTKMAPTVVHLFLGTDIMLTI